MGLPALRKLVEGYIKEEEAPWTDISPWTRDQCATSPLRRHYGGWKLVLDWCLRHRMAALENKNLVFTYVILVAFLVVLYMLLEGLVF